MNSSSSSATKKRGRPDPSTTNPMKEALGGRTSASWGANSLASSSKSSARRSSPFADFGSYMVVKNRKLRDQFDVDASSSFSLGSGGGSHDSGGGGRKAIFRGVSIFVDGFTVPSSQELRGYMLKHGGRFENYFSKQRVTHIVCSHLPDSKMRNLRSFSRGLPVVKPTWVMDSVAANKLLSWVPYQLDELVAGSRSQQKLSAFFTLKSISSFEDVDTPVDPHVKRETKGTFFNVDEFKNEKAGESSKCNSRGSDKSTSLGHESFCENRNAELTFTDLQDDSSVIESFQSRLRRSSDTVSSCCIDDKIMVEPVDVKCPEDSNQRHSTLGDPNFVENYFKNSRLHFIGTWRNRYRKRFLNMINGVKCNRNNVKPLISSQRSVIHIDMDCFFVSVVIRNYPELLDKPVAVCHSDNSNGTAEISSANYPARDYGVRAGMFVRDAKAYCPQLVIFPYNFEAYEEVADQFYTILHKHCPRVQAVSCDEAFLDVTDLDDDPERVASIIRQQITDTTRCTASAGIAGSLLLARLATRSAKPNGQCFIPSDKVDDYLKDLPIKALPGIGYALGEKLQNRNIQTCGQLRMIPKEALQKDFGTKTGDMLWNYSRGIDNRMVEVVQEMKSVGAEVNWGVRFKEINDCHCFLMNLSKEVSLRLQGCGVKGRTVTLKVKKRKEGADEPTKYMGCGECENMSRSMTVSVATDSVDVLIRISKQLFGFCHIDVKDVRGVGLQLSKLETADMNKQGHEGNPLESWLASASETNREPCQKIICKVDEVDHGEPEVSLSNGKCKLKCIDVGNQHFNGTTSKTDPSCSSRTGFCENEVSTLPPISHLDLEVIKSLPPEIISEMNEIYSGRLSDFMEKYKENNRINDNVSTISLPEMHETSFSDGFQRARSETILDETDGHIALVNSYSGARNKGKQPACSPGVSLCNILTESKPVHRRRRLMDNNTNANLPMEQSDMENQEGNQDRRSSNLHAGGTVGIDRIDLMPASLSQVDISILQQLPEELKADILESLPPHRKTESSDDPLIHLVNESTYDIGIKDSENFKLHLWVGNPPKWVEEFKVSNCLMLNILAEMYSKSGTASLLSSILQSVISFHPMVSSGEGWDEALSSVCELLTQYIELKIESDIEEIYICFRILERLTTHSNFFLDVYNIVLPSLQIGHLGNPTESWYQNGLQRS